MLYLIFLSVLILFGYAVLLLVYKKKHAELPKNFVDVVLISFGVGLSLYFFCSYIFLLLWNWNAFTAFFFYPLFSFCVLIAIQLYKRKHLADYIIKNADGSTKHEEPVNFEEMGNGNKNKEGFYDESKKRRFISFLILMFLIVAVRYYFTFWQTQYYTTAHLAYDAYAWESAGYWIIQTNYLDNSLTQSYPAGFVFFMTGGVIYVPSFSIYHIHFYNKALPVLVFFTDVLILFAICQKIKPYNKFFVFFTTFCIFSAYYFFYRLSAFVPTMITSIFTLLLFYLVILGNQPKIFEGLLIGGVFLSHPLYGAIIFAIYAFYCAYSMAARLVHNRKNLSWAMKKGEILNLLKDLVFVSLPVIAFLFVFGVYLTIFYYSAWYMGYLYYFQLDIMSYYRFLLVNLDLNNALMPLSFNSRFYGMLPDSIAGGLRSFISRVFPNAFFFLLYLGCFFYPISKMEDGTIKKSIRFLKVINIVCLVFFLLGQFTHSFAIPVVQSLTGSAFYQIYYFRLLEIVSPFVLLFMGLVITQVFELIEVKLKEFYPLAKKKFELFKQPLDRGQLAYFTLSVLLIGGWFSAFPRFGNFFEEYATDSALMDVMIETRIAQDNYMKENQLKTGRIICEADNASLYIIMEYYFQPDHDIIYQNMHLNQSEFQQSMADFGSSGSLLFITIQANIYSYLIDFYTIYGDLVINNADYLVIRLY